MLYGGFVSFCRLANRAGFYHVQIKSISNLASCRSWTSHRGPTFSLMEWNPVNKADEFLIIDVHIWLTFWRSRIIFALIGWLLWLHKPNWSADLCRMTFAHLYSSAEAKQSHYSRSLLLACSNVVRAQWFYRSDSSWRLLVFSHARFGGRIWNEVPTCPTGKTQNIYNAMNSGNQVKWLEIHMLKRIRFLGII